MNRRFLCFHARSDNSEGRGDIRPGSHAEGFTVNYIQRLASCALILLFSTSLLLAQTVTGSITGVVTDQTGAVVPNAEVTAENVATGVKTHEVTNNTGTYTIRFLPVGSYRITVSSQGFSTQTFRSLR